VTESSPGGPGRRAASEAGLIAVVLALAGFSWGFILVKLIGMPAPLVAFWRLLVGASVLTAVAVAWRVPWPRGRRDVFLAGLAFGCHQLLFITAVQETSVAMVTLLSATQPLLVAVVSNRSVGERVPRALFGYATLALAGVGAVVVASLDDGVRSWHGDLLAVANVLAVTSYFLLAKRARLSGAPTLTFTASFLIIALAPVSIGLGFVDFAVPGGQQWVYLLLLALGSGNCHLLLNWAHPRVSAALASLILAALPLLSSVWAYLVLGEPYTWRHALGMMLVVAAIEGGRRVEMRNR
jgi:drug/metabolite transporter (DMT)-like permease